MAGEKGYRYLNGTYAEVFWNGLKIAECTKISMKITFNREEVYVGTDIDTKKVSQKGEGTMTLTRIYTTLETVRQELVSGHDPRATIITKLQDPDAVGGQIERYQIGNVALNEFPLEYTKGETVKSEFPFGFTPSDMINLDKIA